MDPDPFTLRELFWMAEGRRREMWDHTSLLWAAMAEPNRDRKKRSRPFTPADVHPFAPRRAVRTGIPLTTDVLHTIIHGPLARQTGREA